MKIEFWGVRGSLPVPRPGFSGYGGNTSCAQILPADPTHVVVLDAGTGITALGEQVDRGTRRIDLLLTHLHMDHIIGLGFFAPLFWEGLDVHLWGPSSATLGLQARLSRYLSAPLFPVALRDLPCRLTLHDTPLDTFELPGLTVDAALVSHPGPTVGYRITDGTTTIAYLPDHEPALLASDFPGGPEWTSGHDLAAGVDILVHDAQYTDAEYPEHVGWGHSAISHMLAFAEMCEVDLLVPFHHDPSHDDDALDALYAALDATDRPFRIIPAREGLVLPD